MLNIRFALARRGGGLKWTGAARPFGQVYELKYRPAADPGDHQVRFDFAIVLNAQNRREEAAASSSKSSIAPEPGTTVARASNCCNFSTPGGRRSDNFCLTAGETRAPPPCCCAAWHNLCCGRRESNPYDRRSRDFKSLVIFVPLLILLGLRFAHKLDAQNLCKEFLLWRPPQQPVEAQMQGAAYPRAKALSTSDHLACVAYPSFVSVASNTAASCVARDVRFRV
jgi:hypothetical protein